MYTSGDYFGEQALLTEGSIRSADIYAVTELEVIRFNRQDFYWLLQGTGVLERMKHLVEMRQKSVWETVGKNAMLSKLSASQKTQLEELFEMRKYGPGDAVWMEGEEANICCLIDSGEFEYVGDFDKFTKSRSHEEFPESFTRGAFIGDINALMAIDAPQVPMNVFGLRARTSGNVLIIGKEDLRYFFSHNPGVLLSMLNRVFVT